MNEKLIPCPHCGLRITNQSKRCLYCGGVIHGLPRDTRLEGSIPIGKFIAVRNYIFWGTLGLISAFLATILFWLLLLVPIDTSRYGLVEGVRPSLGFVLVGCVFGFPLAPLTGILGGRIVYRRNLSLRNSILGSIVGGILYSVIVMIFILANMILTG